MEAERSSPTQGPSTPSASKEAADANTPPAIAEVSPGEGAFSPPNDDVKQGHDDGDCGEGNEDGAVGFGPPPAFPSRDKLGKRKRERTLIAVSAGDGVSGAPLEDDSSEEEDNGSGNGGKTRQSQVIHRIKTVSGGDIAKSPDMAQDEEGAKKYSDAMLLASLSDVDSPKKQEESASTSVPPVPEPEGTRQSENRSPKATTTNSSNAPTPLRSNVNPNPLPADTVKPFALMPKPGPNSFSNKRGKFGEHVIKPQPVPIAAAPHSPDGRDPKAVRPKNEKGAREGVYAPHPQHPPGAYPPGLYPGYHPGYPYPYSHPGQAPPPHHASGHPGGHPAYPPGYPYASPYGHYSQGPPGSAMMAASPYPQHPSAYYPGQYPQAPQAHPSVAPTSSSSTPGRGQGPSMERWGDYYSPKGQERKPPATSGPEPVRSNAEQPPHHPLSASQTNKSHVVPSEDGDATGAEGVYGRPPPTPYGAGPPPPGYMSDSMYRPSPRGDGYYAAAPPPVEYNTISRDEGTPPRAASSPQRSHGGHPGAVEYSPQVGTPPRGSHGQGYDYYEQGPPGSHHGAYPPPTPHSQGGYHPDSPPRSSAASSSYAQHPGYGPPPPSALDPYEPYDYSASSPPSSEAHYHVPAAVSNETEPSHPVHPGTAPSPTSAGGMPKYHQFRKGGRSIHSEPIILRKKFSWRNYPELEEYLIANRTDYLRHSALNYTAEQKHFNNRLTEGLLELAAKLNYVFDETCFNFVAVRDRIRCYYKSYVQSSKKRGVVVGFSKSGVKKEEQQQAAAC